MDPIHQINALQQQLEERDEIIQQLRLEAQGAAHALHAAQLAQAGQTNATAAPAPIIQEIEQSQPILKALQTPQIIRDLPSFDGNPIKLHSFLRSIENLMPLVNSVRNTAMHIIWIQAIRSKIIGDADNVLELYGTKLEWSEIKTNLITHYSDRRDEVTLTKDLTGLMQTNTVEDFYTKISHTLSLLVNLLNLNEANPQIKSSKTHYINNRD